MNELFRITWDSLQAVLLALVPAGINAGLFIYVFFFFRRNILTITFSAFILSLFIWQIGDSLVRVSADPETAQLSYRLFMFGLLANVLFGVHFALTFAERLNYRMSRVYLSLLYLSAIFFFILNGVGFMKYELVPNDFWGFIKSPSGTLDWMQTIWITVNSSFTFFLFILNVVQSKSKPGIEKMKALLVLFGYSIPAVFGLIMQVFIPYGLGGEEVPITSTLTLAFTVNTFIALHKYQLLSFSTDNITRQLVNIIKEGVIIVDHNGVIKFINDSLLALSGYSQPELLEKKIQDVCLLKNDQSSITRLNTGEKRQTALRKKDGKDLEVLVSENHFYDAKGDFIIGRVLIIHDISEYKQIERAIWRSMLSHEESERSRMAKQLHDGIGQDLAALNMNLGMLRKNLSANSSRLVLIDEILQRSINETRKLTKFLYPMELELDLISAIKSFGNYVKKMDNVEVMYIITGTIPDLNRLWRFNLYALVVEFYTRIQRFAPCEEMCIEIDFSQSLVRIKLTCFLQNIEKNTIENDDIAASHLLQRIDSFEGKHYLTCSNREIGLSAEIPLSIS